MGIPGLWNCSLVLNITSITVAINTDTDSTPHGSDSDGRSRFLISMECGGFLSQALQQAYPSCSETPELPRTSVQNIQAEFSHSIALGSGKKLTDMEICAGLSSPESSTRKAGCL